MNEKNNNDKNKDWQKKLFSEEAVKKRQERAPIKLKSQAEEESE